MVVVIETWLITKTPCIVRYITQECNKMMLLELHCVVDINRPHTCTFCTINI